MQQSKSGSASARSSDAGWQGAEAEAGPGLGASWWLACQLIVVATFGGPTMFARSRVGKLIQIRLYGKPPAGFSFIGERRSLRCLPFRRLPPALDVPVLRNCADASL